MKNDLKFGVSGMQRNETHDIITIVKLGVSGMQIDLRVEE